MMVLSGMRDRSSLSRRGWIAHCSALALAPLALGFPAARAAAAQPVILVVGDSLSAEYGLARGTGWVALLEQRLHDERMSARIVNASVSGDTTAGGRSRVPGLLAAHKPTHVIIELGGNDALRGLPLSMTKANLAEMVRAAKAGGASVLLVGMQVPPNYGRKYADDFAAVFGAVARSERVPLVPFLLHGIADAPNAQALFQADRIHPTAAAQPTMLDNVWPVLRSLLK
jgi:acyl-CoA thioesterase-1